MVNSYSRWFHHLFHSLLVALLSAGVPAATYAATGIFANSVTLNSKGAGNVNYKLLTATGFNDGQTALPASMGTFLPTETLNLSGGQVWTFKNSGDNVTGATVRWRVYSGAPSGSTADITLNFGTNIGGGGDQLWEIFSNTENLIAPGGTPRADGTYTLEIIGRATTNLGDRVTGSYTTNFTVSSVRTTAQAGDWNTPATWTANAVPSAGTAVQIDHALTVNGTVTNTAGLVTISATRSLTFGAAGALGAAGLTNAGTLTMTSGGTLSLTAGSTLLNTGTITAGTGAISFSSGSTGTFTNNSTYTAGTATLTFFGPGTIGGSTNTTFNNVTIGGAVNFGTSSTVNGNLRISTGGSVSTNAPIYGSASTLVYASGTTYGRSTEWTATTLGNKGAPASVQVTNSTGLNLVSGGGANLGSGNINGNLTIDAGSSVFMDFGGNSMNVPLVVTGNVTTAGSGSLILSQNSDGNLKLNGNLTLSSSSSLVSNNRAVFFDNTGAGQSISTAASLAYLVSNTPTLTLLTSVTLTAPNQGNALSLSGNIDLNGFTLTLPTGISSGAQADLLVNTSVRTISSGSGTGTLVLPGDNRVIAGSGGTLVLASTVRTLAGGSGIRPVNFSGITLINGILELLSGVFVDGTSGNGPQYGASSILRYNIGGSYSRRSEWDGSTTLRTPVNVEVNGTGTYLNLDVANASTGNINLRGNLSIGAGATVDANTNTDAFVVDGNVTNAGTLILSTAGGGDLKVGGNFTNTGTFTSNQRAIFFTGGNVQSVSSTSALAINYVVVAKTAGQVSLATGTTLTVSAPIGGTAMDFSQTSGPNIFNLNGRSLTLGTTGLASNGGTIPGNSGFTDTGTGTLNVLGTGDFGTIRFTSGTTLGTLNLNRTSTSAGATVVGAPTIATQLNLQGAARLTLTTDKLTLAAAATIANNDLTRYVVTSGTGALERLGLGSGGVTTAVLFPVGTAGSYTPVEVTNAGTLDSYAARVSDVVPVGPVSPDPLGAHVVKKTWDVSEGNAGGSNVTLKLTWNAPSMGPSGDEGASFARNNCSISHYVGSVWSQGPFSVALQDGNGQWYRTRAGLTSFSPFAVQDDTRPLPVELTEFTGRMDGPDVRLYWRTSSEKDNQLFDVERSFDGQRFERVGSVPGHGTSATGFAYELTDRGVARFDATALYYRLRHQDFNGNQFYSRVIPISIDAATSSSPVVFPNPLTDAAGWTLQCYAPAATTLSLSATDARGAVAYAAQVPLQKGYNYMSAAQLPGLGVLARGLYVLRLDAPGAIHTTHKLLRQ